MKFAAQVELSPWAYRVVWCAIVWIYSVCATFLAFQAAVYFYIPVQAIPLLDSLELYAIGVSGAYYRTIGSVYVSIAVVHVGNLLEMVFASLWHHRLVLEASHPNYGVVYVTRELIQTAIQTYQAYRLSALVAREWMNQVIVVLLVLNCWATPIIHLTLRSSPGSTRLLCLMVNLALDFVSYIVFPVALFVPYYAQFNPAIGNYDQHFWYTDVWLIQVINEWQMLFVTSLWDAISKFFIAYNITRSLRSIPRILRRRDLAVTVGMSAPKASLINTDSVVAVVPAPPLRSDVAHATGTMASSPTVTDACDKSRRRIELTGHRILALWGIAVLACHVQTAITDKNEQCLVQVRPWFTTRPVCSLMEISCYDGQLTGNESNFNHAIDSIQTDWLAYLIIRHCSAVEITPRIHKLPWLVALKVYNSTLLRWDSDAALTQTHTPHMLFVIMAKIEAFAVPPGLYSPDFPQKLYDIELSDWNVTSLPDEITDVWHAGMFLVIEKFAFPDFPTALTKLRPGYLSISYNNFTDIPPLFWENERLIFLNLNGNPITRLPRQPWTSQIIIWLSAVETQLAELPDWIRSDAIVTFMAGSTPFCSSLVTGNATTPVMGDSKLQQIVNCTQAKECHSLTHYPHVDEAVNNPSRAR